MINSIFKYRYGFDWVDMLSDSSFVSPSVASFRHVPVSDTWTKEISIGMKVLAIKLPSFFFGISANNLQIYLKSWKWKTQMPGLEILSVIG